MYTTRSRRSLVSLLHASCAPRYPYTTSSTSTSSSSLKEQIAIEESIRNNSHKQFQVNKDNLIINGTTYPKDHFTNITSPILSKIPRQLHRNPNHPLGLLKSRIESLIQSHDPYSKYKSLDALSPVVSTKANFDDLLIPKTHPGRNKTDTYYVNESTVLRTHTSAHQSEVLRRGESAFLLSADVYRRDEVDTSHYPVFHQMEGVRTFSKKLLVKEAALPSSLTETLPDNFQDSSFQKMDFPPSNPIQSVHSKEDVELVIAHLKATMNAMVQKLFFFEKDLKVRWVEAYFPFTSPSWEMEIWFQGEWLEVAGCGVIQQQILDENGQEDRIGWAFGLGLERLAMVLYSIPDIRLFWSFDSRFLNQFNAGAIAKSSTPYVKFKPFSKFPPCYKDISFWMQPGGLEVVDNDFCEVVRDVSGDLVEDIKLIDEFVHPKTGKKSKCYRINYRSMDRTVTNEEINAVQENVRDQVIKQFSVTLR